MSEGLAVALIGLVGVVFGSMIGSVTTFVMTVQRNKMEKPKLQGEAKKVEVDAAAQIQQSALDLIQPYRDEVTRLKTQVDELQTELTQVRTELDQVKETLGKTKTERDDLLEGARRLYYQVVSLRSIPVYVPPGCLSEENKP